MRLSLFQNWLVGIVLLLGSPALAGAQGASTAPLTGQVLDLTTHQPLNFVSIGVLRQPFGTVADAHGRFALQLPDSYNTDSVRFSLLGYAPRTLVVADLRRLLHAGPLLLQAMPVPLQEAHVQSRGLQRRVLGNQTDSKSRAFEDFKSNMAGNQLGQRISIKRLAFLEEVSFSLTDCSYDTILFRLNIFSVKNDFPAENLLPAAIYLPISRQQAKSRIYVNLRPYNLWVASDVVVSLELVRSLGKGTLGFAANFFGGALYKLQQTPGPLDQRNRPPRHSTPVLMREHKQADNGPWVKYPDEGLGLDITLLQLPN